MKYRKLVVQVSCILAFSSLVVACKKEDAKKAVIETGTVSDVDGNTYKTVKIGSQRWMAENLNVRHYNDGSAIREVSILDHDTIWSKSNEGMLFSNQAAYGLLYNYFAVSNSKKIAPEGWHVATDEEWKQMEKAIGMSETEVEKLAWRGTTEAEKLIKLASESWPTSSVAFGTDEFGFCALPGGCKLFNGRNSNESNMAFWWTATESGNDAWYRYLDAQKKNIFRQHTYKNYGFSVRCVKD